MSDNKEITTTDEKELRVEKLLQSGAEITWAGKHYIQSFIEELESTIASQAGEIAVLKLSITFGKELEEKCDLLAKVAKQLEKERHEARAELKATSEHLNAAYKAAGHSELSSEPVSSVITQLKQRAEQAEVRVAELMEFLQEIDNEVLVRLGMKMAVSEETLNKLLPLSAKTLSTPTTVEQWVRKESIKKATDLLATTIQGRCPLDYFHYQFPATVGHLPLIEFLDKINRARLFLAGFVNLKDQREEGAG